MATRLFYDRADAGRYLAAELTSYAGRDDVVVLALPRGGVPVAYEVARALNAPLDVFLVRKLGVPGDEEFAMGAIASVGAPQMNQWVVDALQIPASTVEAIAARERQELLRRERIYRGDRPFANVRGKTAILVDDGIATGFTMRAAIVALREQQAARIVVAVPVASATICHELRLEADEVVCVVEPRGFLSIGQWYRDFAQVGDEKALALLERAKPTVPTA
ncbi:MAG: phosphoribosyltransferase [Terriglobales bacterium]